jgi:hypothetical protein
MTPNAPRKSWFERHPRQTLGLFLVTAILALALVTEKILAARARPVGYEVGIQRSIKLREFNPLYSEVLVPSPDDLGNSDGLVRQPYVMRIDENGFIMPSRVHRRPDVILAFLGGSTTECTYVQEEKRFPYLAGRLLEDKTGLRVNSYNAAKSGNNTLHNLNILLNKVVPLKPEVAVLMDNVNDLTILLYDKTYWNNNPYRSPITAKTPSWQTVMKNLEDTFHLARDLTFPNLFRQMRHLLPFKLSVKARGDEFKKVRGQKIAIDQAYLVGEFTMNLQTFIDMCRVRKITPVLMTMQTRLTDHPDPYVRKIMQKLEDQQGITYQQYKDIFDRFNQTIREVGGRNKVLVIDLARQVPPEKEYFADLAHYNDQGSTLVARLVSDALAPLAPGLTKSQPPAAGSRESAEP